MRNFLKSVSFLLPQFIRILSVRLRDWWWQRMMIVWEKRHYPDLPKIRPVKRPIKNILVYHLNGLTYAGTEKNLQLIATSLAPYYKVFFMYGDKTSEEARKSALDSGITFIPFSYETSDVSVPHRITQMQPHFKEVLVTNEIDLIVTASPGYAHYPWNIVSEIPIILVNIFGAPTLQKNIVKFIGISDTVRLHAQQWAGEQTNRDVTLYAPLVKLPPANTRESGAVLRNRLNIAATDFVFGRIGRADDMIFDPIGVRAWQKIAALHPDTHYLIMSPPPVLVKLVEDEKIPRVHFLAPSGAEEDIWAFHGAIDAMAHFRKDGETSGVAIAESLVVGNPIITHRSRIWNAHLEYLTDNFARIADIDQVDTYAKYMSQYIDLKKKHPDQWKTMQGAAKECGMEKFSPNAYSDKIRSIVANI